MGKKVTVYDIAEELGISPSTVSRVLNKSSLISDERSGQILEAAERMGYQKRAIKRHVSRAILNIHLFLPQADATITHFFYNISELIEAIQEGFGDVRLNLMTRVNDGNLEFLEKKKTGQIDGCIFAFTKPRGDLVQQLQARHIPYILLNRKGRSGSYIAYDVAPGLSSMVKELCRARGGNLNPCYIGYKGLPDVSRYRRHTIAETLKKDGCVLEEDQCRDVKDFEEIPLGVLDWIVRRQCNAVCCFNDMIALSILQASLARGIRIPEDLCLTGVDDSPIQRILDRRIDTVSLSIHELGRHAGRWLKEYIIDKSGTLMRDVLTGVYLPGQTIVSHPPSGRP